MLFRNPLLSMASNDAPFHTPLNAPVHFTAPTALAPFHLVNLFSGYLYNHSQLPKLNLTQLLNPVIIVIT